jgi:hypothetical protein
MIMKNYVSLGLLLLLLLLLSACFRLTEKLQAEAITNVHIQIPLQHQGITTIRDTISPLIDAIIKEELAIKEGINYPRFLVPDIQRSASRLTVYYVNGLQEGAENNIFEALAMMQKEKQGTSVSSKLTISPPIEFFGNQREYIILSIEDAEDSLLRLNSDIKQWLTRANKDYSKIQGHDLFNQEESEKHTYIPHIALGRLQIKHLLNFMDGTDEKKEALIESIRIRIRREVFPIIESLFQTVTTHLKPEFFCVYDSSFKECLRKYPLTQH